MTDAHKWDKIMTQLTVKLQGAYSVAFLWTLPPVSDLQLGNFFKIFHPLTVSVS